MIDFERGSARRSGVKAGPTLPHPWTADEAAALDREVLAQAPRGGAPRSFEDVCEGDALDTLTKGPIGLTDEIAFVAGGGAPIPRLAAHRAALLDYAKHPATGRSAIPATMGAGADLLGALQPQRRARDGRCPKPYDVGFQRQCWQVQLLTNWSGDEGVAAARGPRRYRKFVHHGDVVRLFGGSPGATSMSTARPVWRSRLPRLNQRGDDVMPGEATLALPSRERGTWP